MSLSEKFLELDVLIAKELSLVGHAAFLNCATTLDPLSRVVVLLRRCNDEEYFVRRRSNWHVATPDFYSRYCYFSVRGIDDSKESCRSVAEDAVSRKRIRLLDGHLGKTFTMSHDTVLRIGTIHDGDFEKCTVGYVLPTRWDGTRDCVYGVVRLHKPGYSGVRVVWHRLRWQGFGVQLETRSGSFLKDKGYATDRIWQQRYSPECVERASASIVIRSVSGSSRRLVTVVIKERELFGIRVPELDVQVGHVPTAKPG
ncbi:hypothetical protein F5Y17DRAFT_461176 [Xylariaceae sp. FL0594]|nr:hypothetical protein F5Y17DRAFT_461176 [Xylariaceae sp. FL0594]